MRKRLVPTGSSRPRCSACSAFLLACPLGRLRLLIPDYVTSDVRGVRLYRVDDASGELVDAGRIEFLEIETDARTARCLKYQQSHRRGRPVVRARSARRSIRDPEPAERHRGRRSPS